MKKVVTLIISLSLLGGLAVISSCKKEKVKGCMDKDSKNYNSIAEEDDGSCAYEGSIVFWYNKATSDTLSAYGATAFTYYVDGKVVGSSAAAVYWSGAPNCNQSSSITVNKDLGGVKNKTYTYSVKDQLGIEYWTGTANFTANTCTAIQLSL
jgi:hypothetical protein